MFLVVLDLGFYFLSFKGCQIPGRELVTKTPEEGAVETGGKGSLSEGLVGRGCRDMGPYAAWGITKGEIALDRQSRDGVGIVGGPDFREVGKDTEVETVAARGTALEIDVGEFGGDGFD